MSQILNQQGTLSLDDLQVSQWLNSEALTTEKLNGRVVVVHAFQMLCPGCVSHGLPLMTAIHRYFDPDQVVCLGLHSVFEHHHAMTPAALEVFLHEYNITHPVAVDLPGADGDPRPSSMRSFAMRGTPSLLLFDREGDLAFHGFGALSHLAVGAEIAGLLKNPSPTQHAPHESTGTTCGPDGCEMGS